MLDLYNVLSEEDKEKIAQYIHLYGVEDGYIGNEAYLAEWAKNKKHLFHLLGGNLIYKIPYIYKKPEVEIKNNLFHLWNNHPFVDIYFNFINDHYPLLCNEKSASSLKGLISRTTLVENKVVDTVKIKPANYNKMLQIQKGEKPFKAIQKVLKYFEQQELFVAER